MKLQIKAIGLNSLIVLLATLPAVAQPSPPPDKFPPNPIFLEVSDPLLPRPPKKNQQLAPGIANELEAALDTLNQEATTKYQDGDKNAAYEIWNRELRLRKYLPRFNELNALNRVGQIAWRDTNRQQVFFITQRLQQILEETKKTKSNDIDIWRGLGNAFQSVRAAKPAVESLNNVLASVRGTAEELPTLRQIGDIHMSWFDYDQAASTYEEIRRKISNSGDKLEIIANLQQLAYIYDQGKQPQAALNIKTQLIDIYFQDNNQVEIPRLQMAIASDYQALSAENPQMLDKAFQTYQTAYTNAWEIEQYARAGEILRQLIALYRKQGQIEDALQTSQILIEAETRAANYYEIMNAYELIGEIHLERQEKSLALNAFQKGLEIAKIIQHKEDYFNQQIQQLSSPSQ